MNPQQEDQQPAQNNQPPTPPGTLVPPPKSHKKLALLFLIGPTALIFLTIFLFAISNLMTSASQPIPASGDLFGEPHPVSTVLNVILFLLGTLGILTWLPGIIAGLILLLNKNHAKN